MNSRSTLVSQSAALISNVKSLESQNNLLKKQIQEAKIKLEQQKIEAEYISQLMKLDQLPDIEATSSKVNLLQEQINTAQKRQASLHEESQNLQEQIDFSIQVRNKHVQATKITKEIDQIQKLLNEEIQKQKDLKLRQSDLA